MSDKTDSEPKPRSEAPRRKPYRAPRLERLGTLTEITAAVGSSTNKNDHGSPGGPRKTS
jgi:hypothetical protein